MKSWAMNKRPVKGMHYVPTKAEHIASIFTHGVMIPIVMVASIFLLAKSYNWDSFVISLVYDICLVSLFSVSSAFHVSFFLNNDKDLIELLRKSDRAVIYLFIAACYSPWLFLVPLPEEKLFTHLRWLMWVFAFLGVSFELSCSRKYPRLGIAFYISYGIIPGLLLDSQMSFPGVSELKFSGLFYLIGVVFFKSEGIVPFAHAIWHVWVILGVVTHYVSVYRYFYSGLVEVKLH